MFSCYFVDYCFVQAEHSALYFASRFGHGEIVSLLLKSGAFDNRYQVGFDRDFNMFR